ncbi:hypothetical protein AAGS39_00370 [Flavobacterium sp. CGRL2]
MYIKINVMITKNTCAFFLFILTIFTSFSQERFTLSGTVSDSKNNETLIGVNIYIPTLKIGTTTNEYGFYSISIPKGEYEIEISYVGYQTIQTNILLNQNTKNNFSISENGEELQEVVITDNRSKINIKSPEMSANKLSIATIKKNAGCFRRSRCT